jgi:transposase
LFETGLGYRVVATRLGVSGSAVARLRDRWSLRGAGALVGKRGGRVFSFELAGEYGLASPKTVQKWVAAFRREGEDALRPKPKGRPAKAAAPADELERLRQENLELSAKVALLEKFQALREQGRG